MSTQEAGQADLEAFITSPIGQYIPVTWVQQTDGSNLIDFVPTMSGQYRIQVLYGGEPVPGSPIHLTAVTSGHQNGDARASGNGLEVANRGKENSFVVYCATSPNVQIERSDGKGERIEPKVKSLGNNEWRVSYTILSVGTYEIRASCPSRGALPGSPWIIACVDTNKVTPVGGWGQFLDNEGRLILPARLVFETSAAGPGDLTCSVDGRDLGEWIRFSL